MADKFCRILPRKVKDSVFYWEVSFYVQSRTKFSHQLGRISPCVIFLSHIRSSLPVEIQRRWSASVGAGGLRPVVLALLPGFDPNFFDHRAPKS
jgi:hypothetical protein